MKALRVLVVLALLVGAVLILVPSPIDPLGWDPAAPPPLAGALAPNSELAQAERLGEGQLLGPEDLIEDAAGRVYGGTADGKVWRLTPGPGGWQASPFVTTGGRPLGLDWDRAGNLIVCDAVRGLLSVSPAGELAVLTEGAGGKPFRFTDDVAVASDGRIYFSDASSRWGAKQYLFDLLEARPWGRLLRYDPATRTTETLLENLYFANGVALSKDEDFVLVNETYRYRITRYWLAGEKRGTSEVFADNLPGFPDGIAADGRGGFWVAMFAPRNPQADLLHRHPFAKSLLARLPGAFWPKPQRYGLAVQLDANGRVLRTLQDPTGQRVPQVTSAWEHAGWLYLGNLTEPYASRIRL